MKRVWVPVALLCLAAACRTTYLPQADTRGELQRYVEMAARVVEQQGTAACDTLAAPQWRNDRYYVFVTDVATHVTVCHPAVPAAVGRDEYDLQDANGKYFMREMVEIASQRAGGGWVEYMWPRAQGAAPEPKSTFVFGVAGPDGTRYLVGGGGYDLAR